MTIETKEVDITSRKAMLDLIKWAEEALQRNDDFYRQTAFSAVEKVAQEHGYTLDALGLTRERKQSYHFGTVTTGYRNPENPHDVWDGQSRPPRWFTRARRAGVELEDMAIMDQTHVPSQSKD